MKRSARLVGAGLIGFGLRSLLKAVQADAETADGGLSKEQLDHVGLKVGDASFEVCGCGETFLGGGAVDSCLSCYLDKLRDYLAGLRDPAPEVPVPSDAGGAAAGPLGDEVVELGALPLEPGSDGVGSELIGHGGVSCSSVAPVSEGGPATSSTAGTVDAPEGTAGLRHVDGAEPSTSDAPPYSNDESVELPAGVTPLDAFLAVKAQVEDMCSTVNGLLALLQQTAEIAHDPASSAVHVDDIDTTVFTGEVPL